MSCMGNYEQGLFFHLISCFFDYALFTCKHAKNEVSYNIFLDFESILCHFDKEI